MKIRPLHDRLVVKRIDASRTAPSGLVIPDTVSEKPMQGSVLAVGSGKVMSDGRICPVAVSIGERVLFGKHAGTEVTLDGEELVVMREEDLMAVVSP